MTLVGTEPQNRDRRENSATSAATRNENPLNRTPQSASKTAHHGRLVSRLKFQETVSPAPVRIRNAETQLLVPGKRARSFTPSESYGNNQDTSGHLYRRARESKENWVPVAAAEEDEDAVEDLLVLDADDMQTQSALLRNLRQESLEDFDPIQIAARLDAQRVADFANADERTRRVTRAAAAKQNAGGLLKNVPLVSVSDDFPTRGSRARTVKDMEELKEKATPYKALAGTRAARVRRR